MVEEADIWWWVVATNFNVSSRQKFKFYGLSVAFKGLLVANPCLNFCLSITKTHPSLKGLQLVLLGASLSLYLQNNKALRT